MFTTGLAIYMMSVVHSYSGLQSGQRIAPLPEYQRSNKILRLLKQNGNPLPISPTTIKESLLNLPAVEQWADNRQLKEHHLKTLYRVLFRQSHRFVEVRKLDSIVVVQESAPQTLQEQLLAESFPKADAMALVQDFHLCSSKIQHVEPSNRGYKLVVQLSNGKLIETVLIRHEAAGEDPPPTLQSKRKVDYTAEQPKKLPGGRRAEAASKTTYTVCVSSQVGCARACTFCATGTMGLLGQLGSEEILEQVYLAQGFLDGMRDDGSCATTPDKNGCLENNNPLSQKKSFIRNVVFMGMGEPMDNYQAVHEACRGLTHQCLFGLKGRHITISTVGATPDRIRSLAMDAPEVCLALSLHGATGALRDELIPSSRRLHKKENHHPDASLQELGKALDYHASQTGRGAMIEYLLIDGVNDSTESAHALGRFCVDRRQANKQTSKSSGSTYVNLIPYNPTIAGESLGYEAPSKERIDEFALILRNDYNVRALVRWSSADGQDANGACGQLALSNTSTKA